MAGAVALLVFLLAVPATYATDYVVGDSIGWDTSGDYTTWASGKTFNVSDNLVFTYGGSHKVDVVNKADFDSCSSNNVINSFGGGNTKIPLTKTGPYYFICPTLNHCDQGMKLSITVTAPTSSPNPTPGGSGTPPTTPSTSPSTPTPTTPSTSTPTTPSSSATPSTPSTTTPSSNGAMGSFSRMNVLVLGSSLVLAPLLVLMG